MKGPSKHPRSKAGGVFSPMLGSSAAIGARAADADGKGRNTRTTAKGMSGKGPVAVVALGESGEILAAREACEEIFGRDPAALVGQNVCILLKDGFDNDVGRFLHRHRAGKNPAGTTVIRVLAVRKDGGEFLAEVTTLTWQWDTAITKKADVSRLCWTAAFRNIGAPPTPPPARTSDEARVDRGSCTVNSAPAEAAPVVESGAKETDVPPRVDPPATSPVAAGPKDTSAPATESSVNRQSAALQPQKITNVGTEPPREDSTAFRTAAQLAAYDLKRQIEDLEACLRTTNAELESVRSESEKRGRRESELQAQLEAAKEAVGFTEAALREESARKEKAEERLQNLSDSLRIEQAERSKRFEAELVSLRQERDELNTRLTSEQEAASQSTRRAQELEQRLSRNAAEAERTRAELERQNAERQRAESVWREQLDTAWIAKKELEGAWAGAVEQNKKFEEELAKLRQEHDELQARLEAEQKSVADSQQRALEVEGRLSRNAVDSDRARSELGRENQERERVAAEWREQLRTAEANKSKLEASLAEAVERCRKFEDDLKSLRKEHDETGARLAGEQMALAAAKAELDNRRDEVGKENAALARELKEAANQIESTRAQQLKLETALADACSVRDDLEARIKAEHLAAERSSQQAEELRRRLEQSTSELQRLDTELKQEREAHARLASRCKEQEEATKTASRRLEADWSAVVERNVQMEEELVELRGERDGFALKLKAEQMSVLEARERAGCAESQLEGAVEEVKRLGSEMEKLRGAQDRAAVEGVEQLEAAKGLARKLEMAWTASTERARRAEVDLAKLRQEREDLVGQLATTGRESREAHERADELECRLNRTAAELDQVRAEFEKLKTQGNGDDSNWRRQIGTLKTEKLELEEILKGAAERNRRLEAELATLRREDGRGGKALKPNMPAKASVSVQKTVAPGLAPVDTNKALPGHPGPVQQYNFEQSVPAARRSATKPSKRKLQP